MFCNKCGTELNGTPFCKKCGTRNAVYAAQGQTQSPTPMFYTQQPPVRKPIYKKWWFWGSISLCSLIIVVLIVNGFASVLRSNATPDGNSAQPLISEKEYKAMCSAELDYESLLQNPTEHAGEKYVFQVKIFQVGVENNRQYYRGYSNDENNTWTDVEFYIADLRYGEPARISLGDIITVYGEYTGYKITTVHYADSTEESTMFKFDMYYCDFDE